MVDDADFEHLSQWKWHYQPAKGTGYAVRNYRLPTGKRIQVRMHREILGVKGRLQVDHINRDGLDNRRCNLRVCDLFGNAQNKPKKRHNKSGYKGVCWHKASKRWTAQIHHKGKMIYLGIYTSKEAAALAYNKAARKYHGEYACLNDLNKRKKRALV